MDVDMELDQDFMNKFSSLGTTDKDVLISEFQRLSGNTNPNACAFFLDMNNWNLQEALGAYFDLEAPRERLPSMTFVRDITIGEGESVPPNTEFIKTWRIQNPVADQSWPEGVCLRYIQGHQLGPTDRVMVESLQPGEMTDVSVRMQSPSQCGLYGGQWRMSTASGTYFGDTIWVILEVKEGGMLGLTQQLSSLGNSFMAPTPAQSPSNNPFGSPTKNSIGGNALGTPFNSPTSLSSNALRSNQSPSDCLAVVRAPVFPGSVVMNHHTESREENHHDNTGSLCEADHTNPNLQNGGTFNNNL
ncbi:protein ILRUN-like [Anneissia japonica]|uniref:protein ILRUN-like n=1 Tax=Anneissia japonica TaxID=1529436 RepID=UPI00142554B3|nr:protein ILRUN-like [Anneissia japonica]